jgi:ribosomal protein S10
MPLMRNNTTYIKSLHKEDKSVGVFYYFIHQRLLFLYHGVANKIIIHIILLIKLL